MSSRSFFFCSSVERFGHARADEAGGDGVDKNVARGEFPRARLVSAITPPLEAE